MDTEFERAFTRKIACVLNYPMICIVGTTIQCLFWNSTKSQDISALLLFFI